MVYLIYKNEEKNCSKKRKNAKASFDSILNHVNDFVKGCRLSSMNKLLFSGHVHGLHDAESATTPWVGSQLAATGFEWDPVGLGSGDGGTVKIEYYDGNSWNTLENSYANIRVLIA